MESSGCILSFSLLLYHDFTREDDHASIQLYMKELVWQGL
jgi:hypothetical protein